MKIYTRTGDKGETSLLGGKRVSKSDPRIESYGNVDELNAHIGLIRDHEEVIERSDLLLEVQNQLFNIGSHLAVEPGKTIDFLPNLDERSIKILEADIDKMNTTLPEMRNFVLPGGHPLVSWCHISRCVCRRAERSVVSLAEAEPVDDFIIKYLNRLSDFLFVLSRKITHDLGVNEIPWKPRE